MKDRSGKVASLDCAAAESGTCKSPSMHGPVGGIGRPLIMNAKKYPAVADTVGTSHWEKHVDLYWAWLRSTPTSRERRMSRSILRMATTRVERTRPQSRAFSHSTELVVVCNGGPLKQLHHVI